MIVMLVVQNQSDKQMPGAQTEQRQGPCMKTQRSLSEDILEWRWSDMKKWNVNSPLPPKNKRALQFALSLKCGEIIAFVFSLGELFWNLK